MSKIKQFFSSNKFFIGITVFNTIFFAQAIAAVLSPTATPATAVWCVFIGFAVMSGWFQIIMDRSMAKINAEYEVKRKEIEEKYKHLRG